MRGVNKRVFELLSEGLKPVAVYHSCPQTMSEIPCVTFFVESSKPVAYADNDVYADLACVTVDIWSNVWLEGEELCDKITEVFDGADFQRIEAEDNSSFNQYHRRDAAVRKTMKFTVIV